MFKQALTIAYGILIAVAVLVVLGTLPGFFLAPLVGFVGFCWLFGKAMNLILPKEDEE